MRSFSMNLHIFIVTEKSSLPGIKEKKNVIRYFKSIHISMNEKNYFHEFYNTLSSIIP